MKTKEIGGKVLLFAGVVIGAFFSGLITMTAWGLHYREVGAISTASLAFAAGLLIGGIVGFRMMAWVVRNFVKVDPSREKDIAMGSMDAYDDALNLVKKYDRETAAAELKKRGRNWRKKLEDLAEKEESEG